MNTFRIPDIKFQMLSFILIFAFSGAVLAADASPKAKSAGRAAVKTAPAAALTAVETAAPAPVTLETAAASGTITAATLSFDDCFKLASEKNRDYKMAVLDMAVAEAQLAKAAGSFGPTISVSAGYEPGANLSMTDISSLMKMFNITTNGPVYTSFMSLNYYSARVSLSQPIFTFGKTLFGFKMAQESYNISKINYKKASKKLNLDVINYFYSALIAQELSKTKDDTMKANEENLRIATTKFQNGQASNYDVLQAQVQYANSLPEAKKASDNARIALEMLKNTIGLPLDQDIKLSGTPEYKKLNMTYEEIKKKFDDNSDDREQIRSATNIANYNRDLQAAMLLPSIALSTNYTYYSTVSAFHSESSYWQNSWDITVGLQWTLFDSFKNVASIKEADANAQKAELNRANTDNLLSIQLDQLYTSLDQNGKVIEAAGDIIKTAEEGYRIAKESYSNGLIQSVDLLNAETNMFNAKINYLNAMLNYITTAQKLKDFIE